MMPKPSSVFVICCAVMCHHASATLQAWTYTFSAEIVVLPGNGSGVTGLAGVRAFEIGDTINFSLTLGPDAPVSEWTMSGPGYDLAGGSSSTSVFRSLPDEGEGEETTFTLGFQPELPTNPATGGSGFDLITINHFPNRFAGDEPFSPGWQLGDRLPIEFSELTLNLGGVERPLGRFGVLTADLRSSEVQQVPASSSLFALSSAVIWLGIRRRRCAAAVGTASL